MGDSFPPQITPVTLTDGVPVDPIYGIPTNPLNVTGTVTPTPPSPPTALVNFDQGPTGGPMALPAHALQAGVSLEADVINGSNVVLVGDATAQTYQLLVGADKFISIDNTSKIWVNVPAGCLIHIFGS